MLSRLVRFHVLLAAIVCAAVVCVIAPGGAAFAQTLGLQQEPQEQSSDDPQSGPQSGPQSSVPPIDYTMWTLANGLRVVALPDDSSATTGIGTVTTSLWYDVGSKHDPAGKAGLSHLVEHIASRKTQNMPYNLIYDLTADVGGARNASNWVDRTNYWEQVPAQYLETMLWTHAERMARLVIDDEVVEAERDVVKEEIRQRVLASPYGRLRRFILPENAFDVLPHRRSGIGRLADLDTVTTDDVRSFYEGYYGPDTATLIVAGHFDVARLRALVDTYFAQIPPRANPLPTAILDAEPKVQAPRVFHARAPNVPVPAVGGVWKGPAVTHEDAPAIRVLMAILSGGENNRLASALLRTGLGVEATAFAPLFREGGYLGIYALAQPDKLASSGDALNTALEAIREDGVSEEELAEAKAEITLASLKQRETPHGRALELGEGLFASGDPEFANQMLAKIASVSARDVRKAARRYLDPERRISFTYSAGPNEPQLYANPAQMPDFGKLPEPRSAPRRVKPQRQREALPTLDDADTRAGSSQSSMPQLVQTKLSNGIEVIAAKTGDVPLVTLSLMMPGGAKTDPAGLEGLADLAAVLAARGHYDMDAKSIAARFESLGASFEGGADADGTTFTLTVPKANFAAAGDLTASIIKGALYPREELARERARRTQSLQVRQIDPFQTAQRATLRAVFGAAPYGNDPLGTLESLAAINRNDLLLHRQRFYHPLRMQMVVSGGIDITEATPVLEAMFGDWRVDLGRGAIAEQAAGTPMTPRTIVIDMKGTSQASVFAALPLPPRASDDFDAMQIVNAVLGGGSKGRLFQEVRTKRSLAYGSYSRIDGRADGSVLTASAQTRNETAGEAARILLEEIDRLGREGLGQQGAEEGDTLLARRRAYLEGTYARVMERSSGFNAVVTGLLLHGLPPSDATVLNQKLASIDLATVNRAAREYLSADKATLVVVGDADQFLDELRKLRKGIEIIEMEALDLSSPTLRKESI